MEDQTKIIEATINSSLQKNNVTEAVIAELKLLRTLTIAGIDDRAGYKKVDEARKQCKSFRVLASKACKAGRQEAIAIQNAWISKEKEVVGIIQEIEDDLERKTLAIDTELDRIAAEKKEAERKRIQDRIDQLYAYGRAIDFSYVSGMNDDEFNLLLSESKIEFEKEQEKLAEEKRQKEEAENAERIRLEEVKKEQEAERIRLEKMREEQEEKEREMKAEADRIRKQQEEASEKIRKEQAERERQLREENEKLDREKREFEADKQKAAEIEKAKIEAVERERLERENNEKIAIENEQKAKVEAERRLVMKSDKDRIAILIREIDEIVTDKMLKFNSKELQPETIATLPVIKSKFDEFTLWAASRVSELK